MLVLYTYTMYIVYIIITQGKHSLWIYSHDLICWNAIINFPFCLFFSPNISISMRRKMAACTLHPVLPESQLGEQGSSVTGHVQIMVSYDNGNLTGWSAAVTPRNRLGTVKSSAHGETVYSDWCYCDCLSKQKRGSCQ